MKITENKVLCGALVFLAAFFVFADAITPVFHWEDEYLVKENVHIRRLSNIPVFFRPGYINVYEAGAGERYRPLRTVTLALDYSFWKEDPRGYHLTNVLLNACAAVLFWLFCLNLTGDGLLALLAGLLFAVHPVHAESVAWVKNRSDILCAIFYFASAALFAAYLRRPSGRTLAAAVALAVPAFLAKEMALTLPFFMALSAVYRGAEQENQDWKKSLGPVLPFLGLLAAYLVFRGGFMGGHGPSAAAGPGPGLLSRIALMSATAGEYARTLIWPAALSLDRGIPSGAAAVPAYALAALLLAGGPALWLAGRRRGALWLGFFWVLYVPVSNLVPLEGRPFAEQRMYLPSAAFCVFAAWALAAGIAAGPRLRRLVFTGLAFLLVAGLGARSVWRNLDWRSETGLWRKTVASDPSARAYNNLAVSLLKEKRYEEAVLNAGESLKLDASFVDAYNTLGAAYYDLGLYDRSIAAFEKAVFFSGGLAYRSAMNLATLYSLKGRDKEALGLYMGVVGRAPWLDAAHYNMGLTLVRLGRKDAAARAFAESIALNPYNKQAYMMLGRLLAGKGDRAAARGVYADLLKLDPANSEAAVYLDSVADAIDVSSVTP